MFCKGQPFYLILHFALCILHLRCFRHRHLRRVEHIFNENSVSRGGIIYKNVRYRAHTLSVLNDGRARHSLHDAACFFDEAWVGDLYGEALGGGGFPIDIADADAIAADLVVVERAKDIGITLGDLVA